MENEAGKGVMSQSESEGRKQRSCQAQRVGGETQAAMSETIICPRVSAVGQYGRRACGKKVLWTMLQWHRGTDKEPYDNISEVCEADFDTGKAAC